MKRLCILLVLVISVIAINPFATSGAFEFAVPRHCYEASPDGPIYYAYQSCSFGGVYCEPTYAPCSEGGGGGGGSVPVPVGP
jgi:hypothetical protein